MKEHPEQNGPTGVNKPHFHLELVSEQSSGFPGGASGKEPSCQCKRFKRSSLGQEDPLEEGMATHLSILAWRIPWTEEPGGLQSMGSQSQTPLSD